MTTSQTRRMTFSSKRTASRTQNLVIRTRSVRLRFFALCRRLLSGTRIDHVWNRSGFAWSELQANGLGHTTSKKFHA